MAKKYVRHKTNYQGVFYIMGTDATGKPERIYYIDYRRDGKRKEERIGRASHGMTAAKASRRRAARIEGKELSNQERREAEITAQAIEDARWTVGRLWDEYRAGRKPGKGLTTDVSRYKKYLEPVFADIEPSNIQALDVERLKRQLLKEKSPQTVKHVLNLLTWICNFGVKKNLCAGITFHMSKPSFDNRKTEDLTPKQIARLLDAIEKDDHPQAGNIMLIALYTGMRRGEIFKLQWNHVNLDKRFLILVDPKGGPDQNIPLNDAAIGLLKIIPKTPGSPFVFPGKDGGQRTNIQKFIRRIANAAKLPKGFRPLHGLRHVYASMLASSGRVDIYTLQKLLTHKDGRMTQRYAHLRDEALRRATDVASDILSDMTAETGTVVKLKK